MAASNNRFPPVFFWNTEHSTWAFLSQWYPSPFHTGDKSIIYLTAEQYMMHQKSLLFHDAYTASLILASDSPSDTQSLGRQIKNFDRKIWEENRERIVEDGSYYKFKYSLLPNNFDEGGKGMGNGEALKDMFLATGNRELVEASPVDRIWGVGFGEEEAEEKREEWGLNLLGKCLEKARERIRKEDMENVKE